MVELSDSPSQGASTVTPKEIASPRVLLATRSFEWLLRIGFALMPLIPILYLHFWHEDAPRFISFGFHELSIAIASVLSGFVAYVTWRCYQSSGEPFLRWVALGLLGFTLIYLPHGALTRTADCNIFLFLLFGPFSRIVMVSYLIVGIVHYGRHNDDESTRRSLVPLWRHGAVFLALNGVIAFLSFQPVVHEPWFRIGLESISILLCLTGLGLMAVRRINSPLMWMYALALAMFAQSCLSFIVARPWSHQWWLAHAIFATGFFMLSYGILLAFHTTRAFATVYSQEEMMRRLEQANGELERLASYDSLTGAANRRYFLIRCEEELARARRSGEPLSVLMMDLDHFKNVNDRYGHPVGDLALVTFVDKAREVLRIPDLMGRLGGEEFVALLPGSNLQQAALVAERIREVMDSQWLPVEGGTLHLTVSIGVAEFGNDGDSIESVLHVADERLYRAKHGGRNRVVALAAWHA